MYNPYDNRCILLNIVNSIHEAFKDHVYYIDGDGNKLKTNYNAKNIAVYEEEIENFSQYMNCISKLENNRKNNIDIFFGKDTFNYNPISWECVKEEMAIGSFYNKNGYLPETKLEIKPYEDILEYEHNLHVGYNFNFNHPNFDIDYKYNCTNPIVREFYEEDVKIVKEQMPDTSWDKNKLIEFTKDIQDAIHNYVNGIINPPQLKEDPSDEGKRNKTLSYIIMREYQQRKNDIKIIGDDIQDYTVYLS